MFLFSVTIAKLYSDTSLIDIIFYKELKK